MVLHKMQLLFSILNKEYNGELICLAFFIVYAVVLPSNYLKSSWLTKINNLIKSQQWLIDCPCLFYTLEEGWRGWSVLVPGPPRYPRILNTRQASLD
jgi:hypothetical protein